MAKGKKDVREKDELWGNKGITSSDYESRGKTFGKKMGIVIRERFKEYPFEDSDGKEEFERWKKGSFTTMDWKNGDLIGFEKHHLIYKEIASEFAISGTNLVLLPKRDAPNDRKQRI